MKKNENDSIRKAAAFSIAVLILGGVLPLQAGQPLETESARILKPGTLEVDGSYEYQTSSEGTEQSIPLAFEYGITNRLEMMVEPVANTNIKPKIGPHASGIGDTEVTLTALLRNETAVMPALAFAGEVKLPTAKDRLIGTGKADYNGSLIASKKFGKLDTHANLGYTILGRPAGVNLKNIYNFAFALEYEWTRKYDLVAEFLNETSSGYNLGDAAPNRNGGATEISGGESVGMIGGRYHLNPNCYLALGVTYDNNDAVLLRPGITYLFN